MLRVMLTLASVLALCGCGGFNTALHNLQLSGAAEPFPADYAKRALRYLGKTSTSGVSVSYPRTTVGETAFSDRRWYVCLTGMVPSAPPPARAKPLFDAAVSLVRPQTSPGVYQMILILRASGAVTALGGYDSPLCAGGRYQALAAN